MRRAVSGLSKRLLHPHRATLSQQQLQYSVKCGSLDLNQQYDIQTQEEMEQLGELVARSRQPRPGDVIFLQGDLGCGKTCFARGFIRALTSDPKLLVTSPSYLLVNTYDIPTIQSTESKTLYHVDLYRLDSVSEQDKAALGLEDAFQTGVSLVEWSNRFSNDSIPQDRLEVDIQYNENISSLRKVHFQPFGTRWTNA